MIRYCSRCVMPATKPDLRIDEEGVCSACRAYEGRAAVDWDARRTQLVALIEKHRNPAASRKLNRIALETVGDISWPEHVRIFTVPVRLAVQYQIPLIIWGENSQ